jgi:RNA polymerase sigma-70 factor (ECF subfamily)
MEDLIARSYRPAFTLALRLLGNKDDAAEATQEAYLRMYRSLKGFREVGAFPTWLFKIVSNVCLTEMRRRSRREIPTDIEPGVEAEPVDAEDLAIDRVFRGEVEQCLRRLPDVYRTVIVLRDIYGFSGDETAAVLGISTGAVKVRLHRARRRLRAELLEAYPEWGTEGPGRKASA